MLGQVIQSFKDADAKQLFETGFNKRWSIIKSILAESPTIARSVQSQDRIEQDNRTRSRSICRSMNFQLMIWAYAF